jgi:hypothetical protein
VLNLDYAILLGKQKFWRLEGLKMIKQKAILGMTAGFIFMNLAGCAGSLRSDDAIVIVPPISVGEELKEIAIESRDELRLLAKAKESMAQASMTPAQQQQRSYQAITVPQGFEKRVQFKYYGKASEAAKAIGAVAGYTVKLEGNPTPNEPFVSIRIMNAPLNDALRELAMQTGDAIRIEIHQPAKLMRFVYKNQ